MQTAAGQFDISASRRNRQIFFIFRRNLDNQLFFTPEKRPKALRISGKPECTPLFRRIKPDVFSRNLSFYIIAVFSLNVDCYALCINVNFIDVFSCA